MNLGKELILDTNILLRAAFGTRVRQLLETYEDVVGSYSPDVCFGLGPRIHSGFGQRARAGFFFSCATVLEEVSRIGLLSPSKMATAF